MIAETIAAFKEADPTFGVGHDEWINSAKMKVLCAASAITLARMDWRVISTHSLRENGSPTAPAPKRARGDGWPERASSDPVQVLRGFTGPGRWTSQDGASVHRYPDVWQPSGVGLATGGEGGVIVLDVDGPEGREALARLVEQHGQLPETSWQRTGRLDGGTQYFFTVPEGVTIHNTAGAMGGGLDARGEGGFAMLAPSIHPSGRFYGWGERAAPWQTPPAQAPEWLVALMLAASRKTGSGGRRAPRAARGTVASALDVERHDLPRGFEGALSVLGDGPGLRGFDRPLGSACLAWFREHGPEADAAPLLARLREATAAAPRRADRDPRRYSDNSEAELLRQVDRARDFLAAQDRLDAALDAEEADADAAPGAEAAEAEPEVAVSGLALTETPHPHPLDPLCDSDLLDKEGAAKRGGSDGRTRRNVEAVQAQVRARMGQRYALVIGAGGKPLFCRRARPGEVLEPWNREGFDALHANRAIPYRIGEGKPDKIEPVTEFMADPTRPTYIGTCFEPDAARAARGQFNLWSGWPDLGPAGAWDLLKAHIREHVVAPNASTPAERDRLYWWLLMWFADVAQRPAGKPGTAIITRGREGVGKTLLFEQFSKGLADYAFKVSNREHVVGRFNAQLDAKLFLLAEESFFAGDKHDAGILKDLITAPTITVEAKYQGVVQRRSYVRFAMTSNEAWVCPTSGTDARRFLVLDVADDKQGDVGYFRKVVEQMEAGGLAAMFEELRAFRPEDHGLTWSDLRVAPWTPARGEQATFGLGPQAARLFDALMAGEVEGRTSTGETFFYQFNEDSETLVARPHLAAALTDGRVAHGGTGKAVAAAIRDLLGEGAAVPTRRAVPYRTTRDAPAPDAVASSPYVLVPALGVLREGLAKRYR